MKKLLCVGLFLNAALLAGLLWKLSPAEGEGGGAGSGAVGNGDVNGSGVIDISDASYLLNWLFLGGPPQVPCPGSAAGSGLPDTGQTQCYDCSGQPTQCLDCSGRPRPCEGFMEDFLTLQDSFQRTGCPNDANRFTVNADDTVIDNCTGLQWQRFPPDSSFSWCGALGYCADLSFAGHDDWRLPNVRELESIIAYGESTPLADPEFTRGSYWTSTTYQASTGSAYTADFIFNLMEPVPKSSTLFVRAVRGGL